MTTETTESFIPPLETPFKAKKRQSKKPTEAEVERLLDKHLKKYHEQSGRIASVWAMLEFRMDQMIWWLAGVEQTFGACITTQLNGPMPRLRTLKTLLEVRGYPKTSIGRLNKLSGDLVGPYEARNRTIHDPWFVAAKTKRVSQMRVAAIKNKIVYENLPVTLEELGEIYGLGLTVLKDFNAFQVEVRALPASALLETRRTRLFRTSLQGEETLSPKHVP
jgi:hypothetical protein